MQQNANMQVVAEEIRNIYRLTEQLVAFKMSRPSTTFKDVERHLDSMARMIHLLHLLGEEL